MKVSASSVYELKPTWSRLIHRIHTLGVTQHVYLNKIAGLSEQRVYPRQVPSHKEDSCFSLDGSHLWKMNNWNEGWVVVNEDRKKASFYFSSLTGELFHKVDLVEQSQWDCLECLLKVFVRKEIDSPESIPIPAMRTMDSGGIQRFGMISELIGRSVDEGRRIKYTMPVGGGLITREQRISKMVSRSGCVALNSDCGKLIVDSSQVKHVEVASRPGGYMGTFYNTSGVPQLIVEAA